MTRYTIALLIVTGAVLPAASQVKQPATKAPASKPVPAKRPVAKAPATKTPSAQPAAPPVATSARSLRGPLDLLLLQQQQRATLTHSRIVGGALEDLQDANRYTSVELAPEAVGAAWLQVVLARPIVLEQADVTFAGEGDREWVLDGANSLADLKARKGTYRRMTSSRTAHGDDADQALVVKAPALRIYRLEAKPATPGAPLRVAEWALWSPQQLARMRVESFAPEMALHGNLPLKVHGTFDAGARQNMTPDVRWEIQPAGSGTVDDFSRFVAAAPGRVRIVAVDGPIRSEPLEIEVLPTGKPDWDVTFIERQPRFPLDGDSRLVVGQSVRWFAHIKNYGTADADPVPIEWRVDGVPVVKGALPKVGRFEQTEAILTLKWDGMRHKVELVVDPAGEVEETSERNNSVSVLTDAHAVGFWVEDSVLRYFHRRQRELNVGANSWEDWAQRQVASWNEELARVAAAAGSVGAPTAWRLDRIIIVADGMLPMAGGVAHQDPDLRDLTINLACGFPARDLKGPRFGRTDAALPDNPFFRDAALFQSLSRARFSPPGAGTAAASAGSRSN